MLSDCVLWALATQLVSWWLVSRPEFGVTGSPRHTCTQHTVSTQQRTHTDPFTHLTLRPQTHNVLSPMHLCTHIQKPSHTPSQVTHSRNIHITHVSGSQEKPASIHTLQNAKGRFGLLFWILFALNRKRRFPCSPVITMHI